MFGFGKKKEPSLAEQVIDIVENAKDFAPPEYSVKQLPSKIEFHGSDHVHQVYVRADMRVMQYHALQEMARRVQIGESVDIPAEIKKAGLESFHVKVSPQNV